MNDQELRAIVRQAISKQLGVQGPLGSRVQSPGSRVPFVEFVPETVPFGSHASHALYLQLVNTAGACVIEPKVQCEHCGYCQSHGH